MRRMAPVVGLGCVLLVIHCARGDPEPPLPHSPSNPAFDEVLRCVVRIGQAEGYLYDGYELLGASAHLRFTISSGGRTFQAAIEVEGRPSGMPIHIFAPGPQTLGGLYRLAKETCEPSS